MASDDRKSKIVELNVGGRQYATTIGTLTREPLSILGQYFSTAPNGSPLVVPKPNAILNSRSLSPTPSAGAQKRSSSPSQSGDITVIQHRSDGTYFIDRDGDLFRFVLDHLRMGKMTLPDNFNELQRLKEEANFFKLNDLLKSLKLTVPSLMAQGRRGTLPTLLNGAPSNRRVSRSTGPAAAGGQSALAGNVTWGYITVGYRGTFAFGRDGQADIKFRKLSRILVCGRVALCREVFGDSLNESRDPDRGGESRYTSRLYLKHNSLELAFDTLAERGFELLTCCASGTCASGDLMRGSAADCEEQKWNHYNEFIFFRPSTSSSVTV